LNLNDLFDSATGLGKLGIVGILALDLIVLATTWVFELAVPRRTHLREVARADRYLAGWEAATTQFERSLDVIATMQSRQRRGDETA
jgi:hypothetical protein